MEAADQHIRPKPVNNIQHASVGTAAEQNLPVLFFHEQILLMTEVFRAEDAVL